VSGRKEEAALPYFLTHIQRDREVDADRQMVCVALDDIEFVGKVRLRSLMTGSWAGIDCHPLRSAGVCRLVWCSAMCVADVGEDGFEGLSPVGSAVTTVAFHNRGKGAEVG
jgi:hypothetical protein